MNNWLKGLITVVISIVLGGLMFLLPPVLINYGEWWVIMIAGAGFGLIYGLEAGILVVYDLSLLTPVEN